MRMYTFYLPLTDNDGNPNDESIAMFKHSALRIANGYTVGAEVQGAWAEEGGQVYYDRILPVSVASAAPTWASCTSSTQENTLTPRCDLIQAFWDFFPDQKALAVVHGGDMKIINRRA